MRLDPSHAMFKFADQNAMSDSDEWYSDHNPSQRGLAVLDSLQPVAVIMQQHDVVVQNAGMFVQSLGNL